jgi:hypothetical protein
MTSIHEAIDRLGSELVACADSCAGIELDCQIGVLPRSLYLERPDAAGRGCLAVGLNPGTSARQERAFYVASALSYSTVKQYRTSISDKPYFRRTRSVIEELGFDGPILWSNLAKCENEAGRKTPPPLQTLRHCTRRFLQRELEAAPIDWVVFGIGWEAYRALAYLTPQHTVIGFPHPTGGYRDYRKMWTDGQLVQEIRNRAVAALHESEPEAVWLGLGKGGA